MTDTDSRLERELANLSHPDGRVRKRAAQTLGELADARAVERLVQRGLSDDDESVQIAVVGALGKINDARARGALEEVLSTKEHDEFVRREAVLALRDLGGTDALFRVLDDEEQGWVVRAEAALALGRLRDPRSLERLLVLLQHAHERVREGAARALAVLDDARAIDPLRIAALNDENRRVRKAAAQAAKELERGRLLA